MAQGGTIPTNRTQTVTFFNTTGIIEKEKGIYLSPSFKNKLAGTEVREIYLDVLNAEAVKDPDYENINVSSWSPEDRTLTVRGNIDDFRLITDEGDCLNYLVVTRNVTKNEETNTYYYGFFITGVAQSGGSSVKLTLEPDTFTNVFYLHNRHVLTAQEVTTTDYEPFNERMKNCHVNRQHYNRVRVEASFTLKIVMQDVNVNPNLEVGKPLTLEFEDLAGTQVEGTIKYVDDRDIDNHILEVWLETEEEQEIGQAQNFSTMDYEGTGYLFDYDLQDVNWVESRKYYPDNLRIFLNQEESFKFKYQYKDEKRPFSLSEVFTEEELQVIDETNSFANLPVVLKDKVINASISWLVVEMKSQEKIGQMWINNSKLNSKFRNYIAGLFKYSATLISPFFNLPEKFKKYENSLSNFIFKARVNNTSVELDVSNATEAYAYLNEKALADFVFSCYIVSDVCIPSDMIVIDYSNSKVIFKARTGRFLNSYPYVDNIDIYNLFIVPVSTNDSNYTNWGISYHYDTQEHEDDDIPDSASINLGTFTMLMLSGYNKREIKLSFSEEYDNIASKFFDPVLEAEPYSFYSISYLLYEFAFNKNRYYQVNEVDIDYIFSVNGAVKLSYIPTYTVDNKSYKYFSEGLVFTIPANLPLVSDSYSSYYYQNQAQMKNQFAVNDYNRGTDLLQHLLISGPNAVGYAAGKGGMRGGGAGAGAAAGLETANQFMQMADELVDWKQSNKVIEMNQKAKLADMGARPDAIKQVGSDVFSDLVSRENRLYLNHYTIDEASYDSIAKFLERFGYQINLYDTLHVNDRVGWNYIKLNSFDINPAFDIMVGQEQDLMRIFTNGVTLLHDKSYLTNGHNYEKILEE